MALRLMTVVCVIGLLTGCQQQNRLDARVDVSEPTQPAGIGDQVTPLGQVQGLPYAPAGPGAVTHIRQHSYPDVGQDMDPSVDPQGRYLVFSSTAHSPRPDIYIKAVDGRTVTQLTTDPASDIQPTISPDGQTIAFASNRSGVWEIYVTDLQGRAIRQVTRGGGQNLHPSWSPDGTKLVYCCNSDRSGQWELWITDLSGPAGRQFVGYGLFPVWSPTEARIAFQRARGRGDQLYGIWTVTLGPDGEPSLPSLIASSAQTAFISPAFSADGEQLAFSALQTAGSAVVGSDIYAVSVDGANLRRLTQGPGRKYNPTWAGQRIFFCSNRDGLENIWSVRADTGATAPAGQ